MHGAETGQAHPPFAFHKDVFDPVEFDFIDVLVNHAGGNTEALSGEFEGFATDR